MFNGIIYNQGIIKKIVKRPKGINIFVKSNLKLSKKDIGLSVACDGVCLTLISYKLQLMEFYLSKETIIRSKFKYIKNKDIISDLDKLKNNIENKDAIMISPTIKHMPFVQTLTNIIIVAIENKRFANESINQERTNKELEVASEMQRLLFPAILPSNNRVDVAARYETHQLVGGDYYDFIKINNEEYIMCIADVSGKGVSAALLMSNFQANLKANIKYNHHDLTLIDLIHELNDNVNNAAQGEKFITFFIAYYNCTKRKLKYINAGHNYPILTNGEDAINLNKGCIGLGMFDEIPDIEMEEIDIKPNDTLVCYTDGLVELENEVGEQFETDRLIKIIHENFHLSMKALDQVIFLELERFKGNKEILDDTALLSCRFF